MMQWVLGIFLLASVVLDVVLLMFSITRQDRARSVPFAVLTAALGIYTLGYLLEIMSVSAEAAMIALRVENVGIPLNGPFFMLMMFSLFLPKRVRPWMMITALAYGFVMFVCVLLNDWHHLYYSSVEMVHNGSFYIAQLGHGPLYVVQQVVSMSCMATAYVLLFRRFFTGSRMLRSQMANTLIGSMVVLVANMLNFSGLLPLGLDPAPFAMTIGLLFFTISLYRHKLLDVVTIAATNAVATMDDAMVVMDDDWCYIYANKSAQSLFPFLGTESVSNLAEWPKELHPHDTNEQIAFQREGHSYRAQISRITGGQSASMGWTILIRDVSDMTQLLAQMEALATTDALTGILNRRQFMVMVDHELAMAMRHDLTMALIMYDLDDFKHINDTYGHPAGDYVLQAMADTVCRQLRSYDVFARYGGEEFIILTTASKENNLMKFAERLCMSVAQEAYMYEGKPLTVTASFGLVQIPPGVRFDDAMVAVDNAMYQAKVQGKNRVVMGSLDT